MNALPIALSAIRKLAQRVNLTEEEVRNSLNELILKDEEHYYTLAFTMGLMAKGVTSAELKGFVLSYADRAPKLSPAVPREKLIDLSGTGGDAIKTPNVGTIASFILASGGLVVGKQSTRGYTGATGSRDMFLAVGVDVPLMQDDPKRVEKVLESVGICPFYYPSFSDKFSGRVKFFTKLKEIGLTFVTPWHLTSWIFNPLPLVYRVYGMFTDAYLETVARTFKEMGYEHVLVVHGVDGLDELSNVGPTKVVEVKGEKINSYMVSPEDLGVQRARVEDISSGGAESNIMDMIRILYNVDKGPKRDLIAINAGAGFYAANVVQSLREGTELALSLIEEGKAAAKLEEVVHHFGEPAKLEELKKKAGV